MTRVTNMRVGDRYRVTHRNPNQKYDRVSVVDFMGERRTGGRLELLFSQRPVAGTTAIPFAWVSDITVAPAGSAIQVNKVVRE